MFCVRDDDRPYPLALMSQSVGKERETLVLYALEFDCSMRAENGMLEFKEEIQ